MDSIIVADSLRIANWPHQDWHDPQVITAAVSVFIALIALLAVLYNTHLARKHSRISVKPKLLLRLVCFNEDDRDWIRLQLCNQGVGPAEIGKSTYEISGSAIPTTASLEEIGEFIGKHLPPGLFPIQISAEQVYPGSWIAPNESPKCILGLRVFQANKVISKIKPQHTGDRATSNVYTTLNDNARGEVEQRYVAFFSTLKTEIPYASAYGEQDCERFPPQTGKNA